MTIVQCAAVAATSLSSPFQRAHFFAQAREPESQASHLVFDRVWTARAIVTAQTLAVPLAFWFKPVCVCLALFWLVYRASQVLNKPLDELAYLLGFDIPLHPIVDLASIKSDGAIVHWTLPEKPKQKSTLKLEIHLNGMLLESVSIHESAVTITGLQPRSFYVVRVALVNNLEFSSKSEPIRFRTKPASSGDCFVPTIDGHDTDHDGPLEALPRVRLYRGLKDIAPAAVEAAPMVKEGSTGPTPKRSITGRRPSPAALGLESHHNPQSEDNEAPEGAETIQQLTERLDAIRRETEEAEKQAKEEEEDELRTKEELTKERDELRAEANEKERASRNLKREVNVLERQNTAAQNERSKHERLLQQKKQERQKVKDDVVRWEREAEQMAADVDRIRQDKVTYVEQATTDMELLRHQQAEDAAALRVLDDEVREKTSEIKKLERAMKNHSPSGAEPEPSLVQQYQQDAEEDRTWQMHRTQLQHQYAQTAQKLEAAKRFHMEQARYLESIRAERRRAEEVAQYASPPPTQERMLRRGDSQRSRRAPSGNSTSDSPRLGSFTITQPPFSQAIPGALPFATAREAPYLNLLNGMTLQSTGDVGISEDEREKLTGGAPVSPGAGAELLPADLFSGDGDNKPSPQHVQPLPGLGSLPGLPGLPGPSVPSLYDLQGPGPASPASASSRSPSVFASPQASSHNLNLGSPEGLMDADRRSIRSTRSNRATSGGGPTSSRFSSMFGIKQRIKTMSDEGPALGKTQSHSMPRQDGGITGIDTATRKRNSSISGIGFDPDFTTDGTSDPVIGPPAAASRRRAFGLFSRDKGDGWPTNFSSFGRRPGSPRPGSTHSNELPRPSMDSSRWGVDGWPSDAAAGARSSPLSFSAGPWNLPPSQQPRIYGSRLPSRRPSVQYGASGPPEDIMEDEDSDALDPDSEPHLAPIGTKPPAGSKRAEKQDDGAQGGAAKLNPAAKDFKSFFGMRSKDKGERRDGSTPVPSASSTPNPRETENDDSPPNSRKSRDARSMTTTESSLAESGRNSNDLARTPSYSNSDAPSGPSPLIGTFGKESFMQKITRKSSSGKFSLPTFKREKSRLDTAAATAAPAVPTPTPAEDDEDELSASASSLKEEKPRESKEGSRGSGRNWSSMLKLGGGKKKGDETPSLSGLSLTTAEDEDEEIEM